MIFPLGQRMTAWRTFKHDVDFVLDLAVVLRFSYTEREFSEFGGTG